ncbi:DUF4312 family protein [Enterococcus ratti]|uniref:Cytoplasmic protein n=1 Tax=Enterococcus ratti TaxID=150033 RepID=A0A1L8WJG6_9ENTE|nr:DUF4312 family protein [Enterococcus ratti]OJG81154.1 hypothetical protein RV14_GL000309 [Enterococcus ratti]
MGVTVKSKQTVTVSGTGESKTAAFSAALNDVQKKILKKSSDVILRIEPNDVTVLLAKEQTYIERFMFFFLPRKRKTYQVKLQVHVDITRIDLQAVEFINQKNQVQNTINVPFLTKKV